MALTQVICAAVATQFRQALTRPLGAPEVLFEGRFATTASVRGYDVTRDGRRFLMMEWKDRPTIKATEMILVQNWVEELKRRVPSGKTF